MDGKDNIDKDLSLPVQSQLLLYNTEDGRTRVEVSLHDESVWMPQAAMAEVFQTSKQNISLHLKNIFNDGELSEKSVVKEYLTTASDGKNYRTKFYNLEAIIAVGYRVRSHRGTQFRHWALILIHISIFAIDDRSNAPALECSQGRSCVPC